MWCFLAVLSLRWWEIFTFSHAFYAGGGPGEAMFSRSPGCSACYKPRKGDLNTLHAPALSKEAAGASFSAANRLLKCPEVCQNMSKPFKTHGGNGQSLHTHLAHHVKVQLCKTTTRSLPRRQLRGTFSCWLGRLQPLVTLRRP